MRHLFNVIFLGFALTSLFAQESIDRSFAFQNDAAKKYSLYIPSGYDEAVPSKMILGLHPLNTSRWNSTSWRDHLIDFVETNNLLLVCPDGGVDGRIDDPIDTAFTTVLLDSMALWYNVNPEKIFVMGFSWGGRTTYSYGLSNAEKFAGFMPIGAAAEAFSGNESWFQNAKDKPFYIIHGSTDSPTRRFTPFVSALRNNEACVETNLLQGVGHTVDFSNRLQIFTDAFNWLDSQECGTSSIQNILDTQINIYPNPTSNGKMMKIDSPFPIKNIEILDMKGAVLYSIANSNLFEIDSSKSTNGVLMVRITTDEGTLIKKIISQ